MAIYHLSTKPVSRSSKRTATASAAYRAGVEIKDERSGKVHDYTKRGGVIGTQLFTPDGIKINRSKLWNLAETTETRKNSRTAREIVINIPHELSDPQKAAVVIELAKHLVNKYGVAVDACVHAPDKQGDNRNYHAHLLLTTRKLERLESGRITLTNKSQLELSNTQLKDLGLPRAQDELKGLRQEWATIANRALEKAGIEERIDHRSHADRGLDLLPTQKLGWEASALERKGIKTATGDYNRMVREFNSTIDEVKVLDMLIKYEKAALEVEKVEKSAPVPPQGSKKVVITPKQPPIIEGQTVNQALSVRQQYERLVKQEGERIREQQSSSINAKMTKLAAEHGALKNTKTFLGYGQDKRKQKMESLVKQYHQEKREFQRIEKWDFKMDAQRYIEQKYPEAHAKHEEASKTLSAHASVRWGKKEASAGQQYTGEIVAVNRFGVVQETAKGEKIHHELDRFDPIPNVGDIVKISYDRNHHAELQPVDQDNFMHEQIDAEYDRQHGKDIDIDINF